MKKLSLIALLATASYGADQEQQLPSVVPAEVSSAMEVDMQNSYEDMIASLTQGMCENDKTYITGALSCVPANKRKATINFALKFITINMNVLNKLCIINASAPIPVGDCASVAEFALKIITTNMTGFNKAGIIIFLAQSLESDRAARTERAQNEIDLQAEDEGFTNRLIQILGTPLDQDIPPLDGGMVAVQGGHAYGINVHNAHRESATTKAMNLLLDYQKKIDKTIFQAAYNRFQEMLNNLTDDTRKANIQRVLGLGGARHEYDFGGLLMGIITTCGEQNMDPKEFIGRLWHFTETFTKPTPTDEPLGDDRINAKQSLFTGLAESIESNGQVVCNQGKIQRLLIGVLQGRLAGVNIDGEDFVSDAALTDDNKRTLDMQILTTMREDSVINVGKVLRISNITSTGAKEYITARKTAIGLLSTYDILKQIYTRKTVLDTAVQTFLTDNPQVADDPLLKEIFIYKMHEMFKFSAGCMFDTFVETFKGDKRQAQTQVAFSYAVKLHLANHTEIDKDEFNRLRDEYMKKNFSS